MLQHYYEKTALTDNCEKICLELQHQTHNDEILNHNVHTHIWCQHHVFIRTDLSVFSSITSLPCNIAYDINRKIDVLWFVFKQDAHHSVNLMTQQHKYSLERNSLNINSLQANDSGVYHCAAVFRDVVCSGAQEIGQGTTLVVRGKSIELNRTLVIYHCDVTNLFAVRSLLQKNKVRVQFGAVVQELYGKRNLRSNKKKPNHSGPAQNKVRDGHIAFS
uniref:Ig-like domain-containing protein n=1 Tax=Salmo trutta TaxID=8032 RepID=A0A674D1Q9_SALTR